MGKTPKKAAPGGDERNLFVRRLKAATENQNQRESDKTTRTKLTGVQKNVETSHARNFKSKLRSPVVKSATSHLPTFSGKQALTSGKEAKKPYALSSRTLKIKASTMQPKSEDLETKDQESVRKEECKVQDTVDHRSKEFETIILSDNKDEEAKKELESQIEDDQKDVQQDTESTQGAEPADKPIPEEKSQDKEDLAKENPIEENVDEETPKEDTEECDVKLSYTEEDSPKKIQPEEQSNGHEDDNNKKDENRESETQQNTREMVCCVNDEKDKLPSVAHTDTQGCSVDVVESTTSEMAETAPEPVVQTEPEKRNDNSSQVLNDDVSFISFDSSIMLKDVQVKLNDCLKDNSQMFDLSNAERSISEPSRDASFGKTLRNISGRHSINRMRHVTVRSRLLSPNSSLYVNTSSLSLPGDESTLDCKILRHRTGLSDTFTRINGTPVERKRKLDPEVSIEAKKIKTDGESSLFDTSIGMLKGLRRPIRVSTPNVGNYKLKPDRLDVSGIVSNDEKIPAIEPSANPKKWCTIM